MCRYISSRLSNAIVGVAIKRVAEFEGRRSHTHRNPRSAITMDQSTPTITPSATHVHTELEMLTHSKCSLARASAACCGVCRPLPPCAPFARSRKPSALDMLGPPESSRCCIVLYCIVLCIVLYCIVMYSEYVTTQKRTQTQQQLRIQYNSSRLFTAYQ